MLYFYNQNIWEVEAGGLPLVPGHLSFKNQTGPDMERTWSCYKMAEGGRRTAAEILVHYIGFVAFQGWGEKTGNPRSQFV